LTMKQMKKEFFLHFSHRSVPGTNFCLILKYFDWHANHLRADGSPEGEKGARLGVRTRLRLKVKE